MRPLSKPWKPHKYQKKAVKFLLEHAAAALFLDPGLGKTSVTLAAFKFLKKEGTAERALVVAPLKPCRVWEDEAKLWTDFHGLKVVILHGPKKEELLEEDADIFVINYEGLEWLLGVTVTRTPTGKPRVKTNLKRLKALGVDTLILDELSKLKSTRSIRFKAVKTILGLFARRWGLTGSPAANGLLDLFGQCYVLDEGRSLGQYITHYKNKYFYPLDTDGFKWVLQEGAKELIYERLAPLALRMAANDYLELPKLVDKYIMVDLPKKARKVYKKLEDELFAEIDSKTVTAVNAAAKSSKCGQVANGAVYLDEEVEPLVRLPKANKDWVELHKEKLDALCELVDELQGSPLLVGYHFKHDLARLQKRLGKNIPYIGGGVSEKRTKELKGAWNRGEIPVLLGHPQSMAHGLNLQESSHHVCWFALTWNYELYDQFIKRVLRQGNKAERVFVYHILARDTVDQAVLQALRGKARGQNALFKALKDLRAQRLKLD